MTLKPAAWIVALVLFLVAAETARAACARPLLPPLTDVRTNWQELESLKVTPPRHPSVVRRQDIASLGRGDINLDFYSVTIDARSQSAAELFNELRTDLNSIIFSGTTYSLKPLDRGQAAIWSSNDPSGTVMVFTLAEVPGVMPLERGAVFVSCFSNTDFIFSTIEETSAGLHPVAGNRAFGVHDHGEGSLSIFVKAADRVVDDGIFGVLPEIGREQIFLQGEKVWRRMISNLTQRYADRNPRTVVAISRREPY